MLTINENTTCILTLDFKDDSGNAVTPTTVTYRVDDVNSGGNIKATTNVTVEGPQVTVVVAATDNHIVNSALSVEKRQVTIVGTYGNGKQVTEEYRYYVKNLGKL